MCTTRFWDNHHLVSSKSKDKLEPNNLRVFMSRKFKVCNCSSHVKHQKHSYQPFHNCWFMYKSDLTPHFWEGFVCCCFQILNKPDTRSLYVSGIGLHCMGGFYCPLYYSYIITFSWCRKVECPMIMVCRKQTLSHEVVWTTRRPKMESMADDWLKWRLTNGSHDRWRIVKRYYGQVTSDGMILVKT